MLNLQQIAKTDQILLPTLYKSITENRVFKKPEYRESFIKNINSLLSLRDSRSTALSTLNIFCDHHSVDSACATEKTSPEISWLDQLLRIIEQDTQFHAECFEILLKLVRITSFNPDTNKIVQSKYVQKIIDSIIGSSAAPVQSLSCLATCFELHGGTSGIYKNKIYDYCVSFIDIPDDGVAGKVALCLHLMQQSRGGSVAGGVYKKCWGEFHEKCIGSLNSILQKILKKTDGAEIGKSEQLQLPELKLSPEPFNRLTQLFVRFQNLVTILNVSLLKRFATTKSIQVSKLISLVEDGLTANPGLSGKKVMAEGTVLSLLLGQIQMNLLKVLRSLILCLGGNIITHSKNICDVLWRALKQTSSNDQLKFETNLKLRTSIYETLICFMRISPNNFYIKNIMENVMKEAFNDVTPANNEIYLMVPNEKSGKKKKVNSDRKLLKTKGQTANIQDEQRVCAKALECLGFLLVYHGALMKPVLFYILQEKIVAIAFAVSSKIQQEGELYRNPHCRSRLFDLIGFLMTHPVQKMPVPINYGLALLTKVKQSDPDLNVRNEAAMNLYKAETVIHNRKEVFYFPTDYRDLKDTLLFNKQTVLKFNEVKEVSVINGNKNQKDEKTNGKVEEEMETEVELNDEQKVEEKEDEIHEDEDEAENSPAEDSDDEVEEPENEVPVKLKEPENLKPSSVNLKTNKISDKRPSEAPSPKSTPKKQKVSNKKEDEIVEELFADFNE